MRQFTLFTVLLACCLASAAPASALSLGDYAPNFTLKSANGTNIRLSEMRGQVVMINFWASWCGPCRQEMPLLDKLQRHYRNLGFTMLGVNVEEQHQGAQKFLKQVPVTFPILWDSTHKVSQAYDVKAMPSTVIVDRDGKVAYLHPGYRAGDEAQYDAKIRDLLRE